MDTVAVNPAFDPASAQVQRCSRCGAKEQFCQCDVRRTTLDAKKIIKVKGKAKTSGFDPSDVVLDVGAGSEYLQVAGDGKIPIYTAERAVSRWKRRKGKEKKRGEKKRKRN